MTRDYCGITPPKVVPMPRSPLAVARELRAAADRLHVIADSVAANLYDGRALAEADRLVIGVANLVRELRQRQGGGA